MSKVVGLEVVLDLERYNRHNREIKQMIVRLRDDMRSNGGEMRAGSEFLKNKR
jgi:hypothetical protein